MDKDYEVALRYALSLGCEDVEYKGVYKGFKCYLRIVKKGVRNGHWGIPFYILVKDGIATRTNMEECGEYTREFQRQEEETKRLLK